MKYLFFIFSTFYFIQLNSQVVNPDVSEDYKKDLKKLFFLWNNQGDFNKALNVSLSLLSKDTSNNYVKFIVGDCYLNSSQDKYKALTYLEQASDNVVESMAKFDYQDFKNNKAPFDVFFLLGKAYRINYEYDNAINAFNKYITLMGNLLTDKNKNDLKVEMSLCKVGRELLKYPVEIEVSPLSNKINSGYDDYAPVLSADEKTIIFTSRRGSLGDKIDPNDNKYYEKIYISEKDSSGEWKEPRSISSKINKSGIHQATVGVSVDGQQLLIYSTFENPNGNIYYTKLEGGEWLEPIAFDAINSKYSEVDACFNVDGTEIYFSSNRKGGFGGFDLYKIKKLSNGKWSEAENLGSEINSFGDERSPFIHPDAVTLFFASNGHGTMGGFDIFQSIKDNKNNWKKPENIGYPINTTDDDVFYITSVDGKRAYYSSVNYTGGGDKDIYVLRTKKSIDEKPLTVMSGVFTLNDGKTIPQDAQIIVNDVETGQLIGSFRPNQKTGKYLFILPPGKSYSVSYEASGFLFNSKDIIIPKNTAFNVVESDIKLEPVRANETIILKNIFFDFNSDKLSNESNFELNKLFNFLYNNIDVRIEISGHTDIIGDFNFNKELSHKRALSVKKFLTDKGINSKRIETVGYGSEKPLVQNTNDDGSDNPEGRQLNRRIELKVLSEDGSMENVVNKINVPQNLKKK